jgi:hypothetical protein
VKRLAQGEHEGFGSAIDAVQHFRRDGDHRGNVDDRPATTGDEGGSRGVGKSHQRRHVEIDHLFHGIHIGLQQRLQAADARVVNQQGDAGVRGDDRLDPLQVTPVVQVRGNRLYYAARGIGDARRQLVEPGLVACDENEVVAPPSQPVGINRTDSGGGTCDDCDTFVRDGHGISPFIAPLARVVMNLGWSPKCGANLVYGLLGILQVRVVTDAGK